MEQQETTEILSRGRGPAAAPVQERAGKSAASLSGENFTAHNAEFDRRVTELKKRLVCDRAAAESELARLTRRCDVLKEFILENDRAAETLGQLPSLFHAEKEFSARMEQLEIRYYKYYGKFSDRPAGERSSLQEREYAAGSLPVERSSFKEALPLLIGMILSALIIAFAMALIFL
jgi:hypothetical protein